jgi:hypothetical protein
MSDYFIIPFDISSPENKKIFGEFCQRLINSSNGRFVSYSSEFMLGEHGIQDTFRQNCAISECSVWQGLWSFLGPLVDPFDDKKMWSNLSDKWDCFFFAVFDAVCTAYESKYSVGEE